MIPLHTFCLISLRSILISCSFLRLGIPSGLPSALSAKPLHAFPFSPVCVTRPAYYFFLDFINLISGEEYKPRSSSFHCFSPDRISFQLPVVYCFLNPNIFLSTLSSNTFSLCFYVGDQVSHPYKTTEKVIIMYALIFVFLNRKQEDKIFRTEW